MDQTALAIATQLSNLEASSQFASHFFLDDDPELEINGVGHISLPVDIHTAHRLCAVAHPASHGYKDQTRIDPSVRDTWEISADQLLLKNPKWSALLKKALERISRDIGLAPSGLLQAELHNLLVYGPGQFFATHQDSEKNDGMIGTLVITLPSEFSGGEFIVSHQGEVVESRGSKSKLGLVAFYADCMHEVRPVKHGYRVVLTYNLLMPARIDTPEPPPETVKALARAIKTFWQTPVQKRWGSDHPGQAPDRLVYLLDHEYTQASLSWMRLKGADAVRVGALRKVADSLDAEIFLALADVQETWTAEDDDPGYRRGGYRYDDEDVYDDEDGQEEDLYIKSGSHPPLGELIDDSIELRHWIATDDTLLDVQDGRVDDAELCYTLATKDCTPFESEYEGYMGNYGNTVDRWYHRAALIMWPRSRAFAIRASKAPAWAIEQIATALHENRSDQARQWAEMLLPFWPEATRYRTKSDDDTDADDATASLFDLSLQVAVGLNDPSIAEKLLEPFVLTDLHSVSAPWFGRLLEHYGPDWFQERMLCWQKNIRRQSQHRKLRWVTTTLGALANALNQTGLNHARPLAATLLQDYWSDLRTDFDHQPERGPFRLEKRIMAQSASAVLALLEASHLVQYPNLEREIIDTLLAPSWPFPLTLKLLHVAATDTPDNRKRLSNLHSHCVDVLSSRLQQGARNPDNWSIVPPRNCDTTLARFLQNPIQRRLEWPLAKQGRQAIHSFIDTHELPVTHETRRTGRPFTLVLEKTKDLFKREALERSHWQAELVWLQKSANDFNQIS